MHAVLLADPLFLGHVGPNLFHPENPGRMAAITRELAERADLVDIPRWPLRQAGPEELLTVHTEAYVERLKRLLDKGSGYLDPQTYYGEKSWEVITTAAGSLMDLARAVYRGEAPRRAFAAIRPPGHHACPGAAMGFCLINNIALAAQAVLGAGASRVAVVDLDFHHGNGIQETFYERSDVFYLSVHQRGSYPGTGLVEERGTGDGEGFTLNAALERRAGDADLLHVVRELFVPVLREYRPELVLVAAGFDAHEKDPLGEMTITRQGFLSIYRELTATAEEVNGGRIVAVLEGGYHAASMAQCVTDLVEAWHLDRFPVANITGEPAETTRAIVDELLR